MPANGYWYTLIFFKNPVLALIYHTLIYHNACSRKNPMCTSLPVVDLTIVWTRSLVSWPLFLALAPSTFLANPVKSTLGEASAPPPPLACFLSDTISLFLLLRVDSSCKTVPFNFWTASTPLELTVAACWGWRNRCWAGVLPANPTDGAFAGWWPLPLNFLLLTPKFKCDWEKDQCCPQ